LLSCFFIYAAHSKAKAKDNKAKAMDVKAKAAIFTTLRYVLVHPLSFF